MAKRKKTISKKSALEKSILKDFKELERKSIKNSVYQKMYRIQNKLDDKKLPLQEKRTLEKELKKQKSLIGYKGLTQREEKRYKSEKRSITQKISRLEKKIKDKKVSETDRNRAARELKNLGERLSFIKKQTGEKIKKGVLKEIPESKPSKGVTVNEEPYWNVRANYLNPITEIGIINKFVFQWGDQVREVSYKKRPDMVFSVWREMYSYMLANGRYMVTIMEDEPNKRVDIIENQ